MGNGKWEILKSELRKKSIAFSKALEQDIDGEENNLMNMIKLKTKFIICDNIY